MHNSHREQKIHNIAFVGKDGAGKTRLIDHLMTTRTKQKTSELVVHSEEKTRGYTIFNSFYHLDLGDTTFNFIDTPGNTNFLPSIKVSVYASSGAVLMVSAVGGSEGALRIWEAIHLYRTPRAIFINQLDLDQANFEEALASIESSFTVKPVVLFIPCYEDKTLIGVIDVINQKLLKGAGTKATVEPIPEADKDQAELYRAIAYERLAELNEELMECYIEERPAPDDLLVKVLAEGILSCQVTPLLTGSVEMDIGVETLWDFIVKSFPVFSAGSDWEGTETKAEGAATVIRKPQQDDPFSGVIFKTSYDRYVGKLNYLLVVSGTFRKGMKLVNSSIGRKLQTGRFYVLNGEKTEEIEEAVPGDIVVLEKVEDLETNQTICEADKTVYYEPIAFQVPKYTNRLELTNSSKDSRIMDAVNKLIMEDPALTLEFNSATNEMLLSGIGVLHMEVVRERLKNMYDVEINLVPQQIGYLETITGSATVQGKYKKQTGGHGQYGDVHITIEPLPRNEGFEFVDKIVGGVIPRNFIPSVEKGVKDAMQSGRLAGYPVVDIRVILFDGSFHAVDSSDFAFQRAGSMALKKALPEAKPVLLEPIMEMEIDVLEADVGKVTKDLSGRRGKVASFSYKDFTTVVHAEAPLAELGDYTQTLRGMTVGLGMYSMKLKSYEILMPSLADKVIAGRKPAED
jgi:elongation factor G